MYEELNKYQWYAHKNKNTYYAYRAAKAGEKRKSRCIKMHEEVMKLRDNFINPKSEILNPKQIQNSNYQNTKTIIDHINGDGRDPSSSRYTASGLRRGKQPVEEEKCVIDHINGDGRDNRIENLRPASYSQNSQNRRKISRRCGSQYKGVWLDKKTNKWRAQICFSGKKKHLGYYSDEAEAARAYDAAAVKYHGRFAKLNFRKKRISWCGGKSKFCFFGLNLGLRRLV